MRETEESLTSVVRDVLSLSDLIFFRLELKSVQGFFWLDSWNLRTILIVVFSEVIEANECEDVEDHKEEKQCRTKGKLVLLEDAHDLVQRLDLEYDVNQQDGINDGVLGSEE